MRVAGYCVCCCDYTLCDRETRETTKKYRRHLKARNSTGKKGNSVLTRNKKWCEQKPAKVKKNVSFKKDPKYCDPATKFLRLLVGGNPKSNKPFAKIVAGKKCADPCAFLH